MKTGLIAIVCLGLLTGILAVPQATGQSGEVVMISYAGALQEPHRLYLVEPFERLHPGVKVRLVPDEAGEYVARVQAAAAVGCQVYRRRTASGSGGLHARHVLAGLIRHETHLHPGVEALKRLD